MSETISRDAFIQDLSSIAPEALRALLEVTEHGAAEAETAGQLAERVATCLWWSWSTPLGYVARSAPLDEIVDDVARQLGREDLYGDAWERLDALQSQVLERVAPAALEDLPDDVRRKLNGPKRAPSFLGGAGAGSAWGAGRVGAWVVRLGAGPIGRLLPLIPALAPYWRALRATAAVAAAVGTPLAVGLGVASVNHAMGTNYQRVVPLLLGIGALRAARD
jgi:hypothetical protein